MVYLMALSGTKQSSLLWPADELLQVKRTLRFVLGEAPLADHHGVLWAGPTPLFLPLSPHWLTTMGQLYTSEHEG